MTRHSKDLHSEIRAWLDTEIETRGPGARLPTVRQMMRRFSTAQRTIEAVLAPYLASGRLTSRRGAGIVIPLPPQPDAPRTDVLILYRLSDSRLARNLLMEIERRLKAGGKSLLMVGFTEEDQATGVLARLGRFRVCLVQVHFANLSIPFLAEINQHADFVVVDGVSATGLDVDGIGTNWREALGAAYRYLMDAGHEDIAFLTSSHPARQIAMARREYTSLRQTSGPGTSWLIELDALPGDYTSAEISDRLSRLRNPDGRFPFSAIVVWGVVEGYILERALLDLNVGIGQDLSVVMLGSVDFQSEHNDRFDIVGCSNAEKIRLFEKVISDRLAGRDKEPDIHYLPVHRATFGSVQNRRK
ncbi:LacI family DNA-binding transcriptional regulator [Roseibium marinum]|uniref:DNA-binding LacI/PurR family transcriptional regulator n=1 Tax=Roseibium marinum TaxID=281252 RepID=A0A2S3UJV5_9HYPH|nr:hypothetical protein [Roseibium marinum]POF28004.1 DNA-binding LacI/PurR family transcriptional regulator [Roseibium marinum]